MHRRVALAMATLVLACLSLPAGAFATRASSKTAAERLIEAYTPRLMVREKTKSATRTASSTRRPPSTRCSATRRSS